MEERLMKKIMALTLVLCMTLCAFPAFAESADDDSGLGSLLFKVAEKLEKKGKEEASKLGSALKEKIENELENPDSELSELLSDLTEDLAKGEDSDLGMLLDALLGGGTAEGTVEDDESIEAILEELNREAEAETGDGVPGKKNAESMEEFYGLWRQSKYILFGEETEINEYDEGVFIGENTYYITRDGERDTDYPVPETVDMTLRNGILKINYDRNWVNFVLTEDGEMVQPGSTLLLYYVRAEPAG